MFRAKELRNRMEFGKRYSNSGQKTFVYKFAKNKDFAEGTYRMRFNPADTTKCPYGWHLTSTHGIETVAGQPAVRVLAQECVDPDNPVGILDRLLAVIDENKIEAQVPEDVAKALKKLQPWRRILIPTVWYARPVANGDQTSYVPSDTVLTPLIWEVTAPGLLDRIGTLMEQDRLLNDELEGRFCTFRKGSAYKYSLDPEPHPSVFPKEHRKLITEDYPSLATMGQKDKKDPAAIISLLKSAWWAPHLTNLGIDLTNPAPGQALKQAKTVEPDTSADTDAFVFDDDDIDDGDVPF